MVLQKEELIAITIPLILVSLSTSIEIIFGPSNRFLFLVKIFFILIFDKLFFLIVYPVSVNNLHKYSFRCAKTITISMFVTHKSTIIYCFHVLFSFCDDFFLQNLDLN